MKHHLIVFIEEAMNFLRLYPAIIDLLSIELEESDNDLPVFTVSSYIGSDMTVSMGGGKIKFIVLWLNEHGGTMRSEYITSGDSIIEGIRVAEFLESTCRNAGFDPGVLHSEARWTKRTIDKLSRIKDDLEHMIAFS